MLWLLKLTLAPLLIALASLAGRRWGPRIAGWIVGFPIVAGPTLLFYALEQGTSFTSEAAYKTVVALFAYCGFALGYTWLVQRFNRWISLVGSWGIFFLSVALLNGFYSLSLWPTLGLVSVALALTWYVLPNPHHRWQAAQHSKWDLLVRMAAASALVFTLTELAHVLGPNWSGLLTPFPVAASVLITAAHMHHGYSGALSVLSGILIGLISFGCFCAVLSYCIIAWGIGWGFAMALSTGTLVQLLILKYWPKASG